MYVLKRFHPLKVLFTAQKQYFFLHHFTYLGSLAHHRVEVLRRLVEDKVPGLPTCLQRKNNRQIKLTFIADTSQQN
jgi:hypothetical protein